MSLQQLLKALTVRKKFVIASHSRPDGDSIGSQLALAFALKHLEKEVLVVNRDPAPTYLQTFPGISDIEVTKDISGSFDAAVVLECGSLDRTGVSGLDQYFVINIDHHVNNTMYGQINWHDESAAACGEMVFDIVKGLGVPLLETIATHIYLAILTDTGSFHYSNITPRTFEICHQIASVGVSPVELASQVYRQSSIGKLHLTGTLLNNMELVNNSRIAILYVDDQILSEARCEPDDMEGLINLPLTAKDIQAVVLFKKVDDKHFRVSLRSKGNVDVRSVAATHGGGGHHNAAGFLLSMPIDQARTKIASELVTAIEIADIKKVK